MSRSLRGGATFQVPHPKEQIKPDVCPALCTRASCSSCQHNRPGPLNLRLSFRGGSLSCQAVLTDRKHPVPELLCSCHLWSRRAGQKYPLPSPITSHPLQATAMMLGTASLSASSVACLLWALWRLFLYLSPPSKGRHLFPKQPTSKVRRHRRQISQPGSQARV